MIRRVRGSSTPQVSYAIRYILGDIYSSSSCRCGGDGRGTVIRQFSEGGEKDGIKVITSDDDLDGYWKGMESRVSNSSCGKRSVNIVGRGRVPRTDEDVWGEAGLYLCSSNCPRYATHATVTCDHSCKKRS